MNFCNNYKVHAGDPLLADCISTNVFKTVSDIFKMKCYFPVMGFNWPDVVQWPDVISPVYVCVCVHTVWVCVHTVCVCVDAYCVCVCVWVHTVCVCVGVHTVCGCILCVCVWVHVTRVGSGVKVFRIVPVRTNTHTGTWPVCNRANYLCQHKMSVGLLNVSEFTNWTLIWTSLIEFHRLWSNGRRGKVWASTQMGTCICCCRWQGVRVGWVHWRPLHREQETGECVRERLISRQADW